jgi:hypothetical protein
MSSAEKASWKLGDAFRAAKAIMKGAEQARPKPQARSVLRETPLCIWVRKRVARPAAAGTKIK